MNLLLEIAFGISLSEKLVQIFSKAESLARERGHSILGTEHVVYCMLETHNRALQWIADVSFPENEFPIAGLRSTAQEWIDFRVLYQPQVGQVTNLVLSEALSQSMELARQIGARPVRDKDVLHAEGLIASEFFLAGLLAEGTGIGAEALTRASHGKVNSVSVLQAIGLDPTSLLRPDTSKGAWNEFIISPSPFCQSSVGSAWQPADFILPDPDSHPTLPVSPTYTSNWLIPGRLIIGAAPSSSDVIDLVTAGVSTFVCLIGDCGFTTEYYRTKSYPLGMQDNHSIVQTLTFLHFPIADMEVTNSYHLARFVRELKRRLIRGDCLYIHCAGGHGRTGLAVIPLMSALYDIPISEAMRYVNRSTAQYRQADRRYPQTLPETPAQERMVHDVEPFVRKHKR